MTVEKKIKELKFKFDWNNIQLAKAAGVSKQAISTWTNRGVIPSYNALNTLRKKYGVNPEWLVGSDANMLITDRPATDAVIEPDSTAAMRDELRGILLEISLGDPAEAERVIAILKAYLNK